MKTIYFFPLLIFLSLSLTGCTLIDELLDETRQSSSSLETAVTSQSLSMVRKLEALPLLKSKQRLLQLT